MENGILLWYGEQNNELKVSRSGEKLDYLRVIWCLPCLNASQEDRIYRHLNTNASHRYLIDLSENTSVSRGLMIRFS